MPSAYFSRMRRVGPDFAGAHSRQARQCGGATPLNPQVVPSGGATPPINVNPAVRNIEKIEK